MKRGSPIRFWAAGLLLCSALSGPAMLCVRAQTGQSHTLELLEQARSLDGRGRIDQQNLLPLLLCQIHAPA